MKEKANEIVTNEDGILQSRKVDRECTANSQS